jgi:hypothetical protein
LNSEFLRREWGAVTFVLTVLIGVIVVPIALYFGNQNPPPPVTLVSPSPSPSLATPARESAPTPGAIAPSPSRTP